MTEQQDELTSEQVLLKEMHALRVELADNTRKTDLILRGFPAGDPDGHCRYHEEEIERRAEWRKLRQEMITHLAKSSTWAAIIGGAFVLWKALGTGILFK